jgi:starch synthase
MIVISPQPASGHSDTPWNGERPGRTPRMRVLMVASEVAPWSKTGGLADVAGSLPAAIEELGHHVTVVTPKYRGVDPAGAVERHLRVTVGKATCDVAAYVRHTSERLRHVFIDFPPYFDRDGLYGSSQGDYEDNARRFGLLALAALEYIQVEENGADVDVVHAHDWQAGLLPALLRTEGHRWPRAAKAGTVFTIHNLAYQGLFARETVDELGLSWDVFTMTGAEYWEQLSFLKAGVNYSDWVTTVSPSYARETLTPAFGCGFEGVLRARGARYVGILNGIDDRLWNPATDPHLPAHFDAEDLSGKAACKRALLDAFGLPVGDDALRRPCVGIVSRLVDQKGFDLFEEVADALLELDASWVVVGSGDERYETMWRQLRERYPSRVGVFIGFNERLAHLVEAGADLFLMPSRFEPCGLNQMYSLRYGTVPVVRAVGGLEDTVRSYTSRARRANGFKFEEASGDALLRTLRYALRVYRDPVAWDALVGRGMAADHSWGASAREYVKVYGRARRDGMARAR